MDLLYQFLPRRIWLTFLEQQWVLCLYSALSQESNCSMQMWRSRKEYKYYQISFNYHPSPPPLDYLVTTFSAVRWIIQFGYKEGSFLVLHFFSPFCWPSWIGLIKIINNSNYNNNNKLYSGALDHDIARELLIFNGVESLGSSLLLLMS